MQPLQFIANARNGLLVPPAYIRTWLEPHNGKQFNIRLTEAVKIRTNPQNRFYQGPFILALQQCLLECGHRVSHDDIHAGLRDAYAKNAFLIPLPGGASFRVPPSTSRLSTQGFSDFLEEIRVYFAEQLSWALPHPNENRLITFDNH